MQETQNGVLNTLATALIAYGVTALNSNFLYSIIAIVIGLAVYVGKEVLKKYGIDLGSIRKK